MGAGVVDKANEHTELEKAREIYDHVVSTVKYDKSGHGWGCGDIYNACQTLGGNCTDFHAIFFGAHDENRIEFSKDRDLPLTPRQHGELLNYSIRVRKSMGN